jgi:hypothetical protein
MKALAITFTQLLAFGQTQIGNTFNGASPMVVNGLPWQFRYQDRTVTQTGTPPTAGGLRITHLDSNMQMNPGQLLITRMEDVTIVVDDPN